MSDRREKFLHWAAAISVITWAMLAMAPASWQHRPIEYGPLNYRIGGILGGTMAVFHLLMLLECLFKRGRWSGARVLWVVCFFLIPVAPAVIYLLFTRSRTFQSAAVNWNESA